MKQVGRQAPSRGDLPRHESVFTISPGWRPILALAPSPRRRQEGESMADTSGRFDRFVLIACGLFAALMTGLTFGATDKEAGIPGLAIFIVMGLVPYAFTAALSGILPFRRLILATTRAVAVIYGVFDCGLRYLALYHPTG